MSYVLASTLAVASVLAVAAFPGLAAPSGGDPLAIYRDKARVLVVVAPDPSDPRLRRQLDIFTAMKAGAAQRDLALVQAIGNEPKAIALRQRFDLDKGDFRAILIGKDGGDKLSAEQPLGAEALFPLIDAMPMRQEEMRKQ